MPDRIRNFMLAPKQHDRAPALRTPLERGPSTFSLNLNAHNKRGVLFLVNVSGCFKTFLASTGVSPLIFRKIRHSASDNAGTFRGRCIKRQPAWLLKKRATKEYLSQARSELVAHGFSLPGGYFELGT
jgi:hypothetical protein